MTLRRGFTLLELLIVVSVVAIVVAVIVPSVQDDDEIRLQAAATLLRSDIEAAQIMTISYPDDPIIVKFGDDGVSYWLARPDTPDTPITRASGDPYTVTFGVGRGLTAIGTSISSKGLIGGDVLSFNAHGGLEILGVAPAITLDYDVSWRRLTISNSTGSITETTGSS